jgi:hypothetical protein
VCACMHVCIKSIVERMYKCMDVQMYVHMYACIYTSTVAILELSF